MESVGRDAASALMESEAPMGCGSLRVPGGRKPVVAVIDFQMGNVGSIVNMIAKVGGAARVTADPKEIRQADHLVLPGVGHFDRGMENLAETGLIPILSELVTERRVPVLGICLGMQLMCCSSEEGDQEGLGWIDAVVKRFDTSAHPALKVPHMGWNVALPVRDSALFDTTIAEPPRFYFVHSYYVECRSAADVLTATDYGGRFCSSLLHDNVCGIQFHAEKSHAFGMAFFRRYLEL